MQHARRELVERLHGPCTLLVAATRRRRRLTSCDGVGDRRTPTSSIANIGYAQPGSSSLELLALPTSIDHPVSPTSRRTTSLSSTSPAVPTIRRAFVGIEQDRLRRRRRQHRDPSRNAPIVERVHERHGDERLPRPRLTASSSGVSAGTAIAEDVLVAEPEPIAELRRRRARPLRRPTARRSSTIPAGGRPCPGVSSANRQHGSPRQSRTTSQAAAVEDAPSVDLARAAPRVSSSADDRRSIEVACARWPSADRSSACRSAGPDPPTRRGARPAPRPFPSAASTAPSASVPRDHHEQRTGEQSPPRPRAASGGRSSGPGSTRQLRGGGRSAMWQR
jgi:hypothetical protein